MSNLEEPNEYMKDPLFQKREFGDYSAFYITITICTIFGGILILLNVFMCCSSRYKDYWTLSWTGNRWVIPLFTSTPHKQPPLDLTELNYTYAAPQQVYDVEAPEGYLELKKRESDL